MASRLLLQDRRSPHCSRSHRRSSCPPPPAPSRRGAGCSCGHSDPSPGCPQASRFPLPGCRSLHWSWPMLSSRLRPGLPSPAAHRWGAVLPYGRPCPHSGCPSWSSPRWSDYRYLHCLRNSLPRARTVRQPRSPSHWGAAWPCGKHAPSSSLNWPLRTRSPSLDRRVPAWRLRNPSWSSRLPPPAPSRSSALWPNGHSDQCSCCPSPSILPLQDRRAAHSPALSHSDPDHPPPEFGRWPAASPSRPAPPSKDRRS